MDEKVCYVLNVIYEGVIKAIKCFILPDQSGLLGATVLFLRFVVTVPVVATGMASAGARRPHMVFVAVEWGYKA